MTMRTKLRLAGALVLSAALTATLAGTATADHRPARYPDRIELPVGFLPEGITIGKQPVAYLGSRADGDIYAADLRTGEGRVISQGPGTASVGLKIDRSGRLLYVAGGGSGSGRVVDIRAGATAASYQFTDKPSFINDVVLTKRTAWFTNSLQPELYGLSTNRPGKAAKVRTLPLRGEWVQSTDGNNNANGIAETPDRKALLVVQSNTGLLFRVDPATGVAHDVDLGGYLLTNGDGLLVEGRTLYVVQNRLNKVAVIKLNARGTRGELVRTLTSPEFRVPTTVASYRGDLYLPNARFGDPNPTTLDYWVTKIPR